MVGAKVFCVGQCNASWGNCLEHVAAKLFLEDLGGPENDL